MILIIKKKNCYPQRLQDFIHLLEVSSLTKEQVKSLLNYLAIKANIIDTKQFIDKLVENAPDHRKEVMTIADYMEQQGLQKGLQRDAMKPALKLRLTYYPWAWNRWQ